MLRILTYDEICRSEWDLLVRESKTGTWFQSPDAYDFFASQPNLFRPFVVGVARKQSSDDNVLLKGVCVGYVTKEKSALTQFFTRRAIIIGGPALSDDCTEAEAELLMNGLKNLVNKRPAEASIYIETRNFNDYSRWRVAFEKAGFVYKKHLNFHIDCTDKEAMDARLSENRKRQIRKQESTQTLSEGQALVAKSEDEVLQWYEILQELYRTKVKTPLWPVEFFLDAYRQGIAQFLLIRYEGKVIGGSMVTMLEGRCLYEWFECGLNGVYKDLYPSVMVTYAGMHYAHDNGCARYDMMGAGEPDVPYGVRDFKSEFGGQLVEHGRFLYICKPLLYRLGVLGVKMMRGCSKPILPR